MIAGCRDYSVSVLYRSTFIIFRILLFSELEFIRFYLVAIKKLLTEIVELGKINFVKTLVVVHRSPWLWSRGEPTTQPEE